jgi:hypothetical protein
MFDKRFNRDVRAVQISNAKAMDGYWLQLTFSNGDKGEINLSRHIQFLPRLVPLDDPAIFHQVYVDHGTICWPGDIDLDPIVIHHLTMGLPIDLVHPDLAAPKETFPVSHTSAAVRTAP